MSAETVARLREAVIDPLKRRFVDRGEVIDLLPDREVNSVKTWLSYHPDVEVISRNRSSSYA